MSTTITDRIEKKMLLKAPRFRVWRALTDAKEFGTWFEVEPEDPFVPGARVRGKITTKGYEGYPWEITVDQIEPERLFSFRWHPYAIDPGKDYLSEPSTVVEFRLEEVEGGTMLTIVESGFDKIPAARRAEAYRMNETGWGIQIENIARHVATH